MEGMDVFFSKMIGTLAVILVVAGFIGGSDLVNRFMKDERHWKYSIIAGLLGGMFGIYGNLSGVALNGAVVSVRDVGPMLAGFTGGPLGGVFAGLICGLHRLTMGGITALACVVATCTIGLICGLLSWRYHDLIEKPYFAILIGIVMECLHLGIVLAMVKPYETALGIVKTIALPFILVNAVGFAMMIAIITYTERQRRIALERSRLQSELEVANVIQSSLLPDINESYPGRDEVSVAASIESAKEVGGDFYDVFFVDNNRLAFVIADVSGKGIPAALFMASGKSILQNCVRDIPELSAAMQTANNVLCARNEAEMFVTVWVGVLDLVTKELTYVCAGHNPPVILKETGQEHQEVSLLSGKRGFVLAGLEDVPYHENVIRLDAGDTLFLYTDGIVEAETAGHELYGEERLLNCLRTAGRESAGEYIEDVKTEVTQFVAGNAQFDDMTMLCFKVNGYR